MRALPPIFGCVNLETNATMKKAQLQLLKDDAITYRLMHQQDLHASADCFTHSFQREPMVRHLKIQKEDFNSFALVCCQHAIHQGLGLVAVEDATQKVAGFTILQDALDDLQIDLGNYQFLLPIFEMLGQLQSQYISEKNVKQSGEVIVSFVTGVYPEFEGSKIAHSLFGRSIELAKSRHYQKMITEVTGRLSQNGVRRRYSFTPYSSVLYRDFLFEGKRIFDGLEDSTLSCVLMEKNLTD